MLAVNSNIGKAAATGALCRPSIQQLPNGVCRDTRRRFESGARGSRPPPRCASLNVIVHQTHRLHQCIHRGGPHKTPTALAQILRQCNGLRGRGHAAQGLVCDLTWPGYYFWLKLPEVGGERAEFATHLLCAPGIVDG